MAQDFSYQFDIRLPAVPNITDPQLHKEFLILYNSIRQLADWRERINSTRLEFIDSMGVGALVAIHNDAGVPKVKLAQHGVNECVGYVTIPASAGQAGEIKLMGYSYVFSGLAPGMKLWLSTTPGAISGACPGAGCQRIGYAVSSTAVWINPQLL